MVSPVGELAMKSVIRFYLRNQASNSRESVHNRDEKDLSEAAIPQGNRKIYT